MSNYSNSFEGDNEREANKSCFLKFVLLELVDK